MRITIRFTADEEKAFKEMEQSTGLQSSKLIKKCLFNNSSNGLVHKDMIMMLGKVSTNINLAKAALCNQDIAKDLMDTAEKGGAGLWQDLLF